MSWDGFIYTVNPSLDSMYDAKWYIDGEKTTYVISHLRTARSLKSINDMTCVTYKGTLRLDE